MTVLDPEFLEVEDVFELHAESIERAAAASVVGRRLARRLTKRAPNPDLRRTH